MNMMTFKNALLEKPVKGLYLNRNKKNVERVLDQNYVEHHPNCRKWLSL